MDEEMNLSHLSEIRFSKKPIPLSPHYRPLYKIAVLSLMLRLASRGNSASLTKIHFLSWIIKSEVLRSELIYELENRIPSQHWMWRLEPSVNRALSFAVSDHIMVQRGTTYTLTEQGIALADKIAGNSSTLEIEKEFLKLIGKRVTEQYVKDVTRRREG